MKESCSNCKWLDDIGETCIKRYDETWGACVIFDISEKHCEELYKLITPLERLVKRLNNVQNFRENNNSKR